MYNKYCALTKSIAALRHLLEEGFVFQKIMELFELLHCSLKLSFNSGIFHGLYQKGDESIVFLYFCVCVPCVHTQKKNNHRKTCLMVLTHFHFYVAKP